MPDVIPERLSRNLIRKAENYTLPLDSLRAIVQIRRCLEELESTAVKEAREKGATVEDIAEAMGVTRPAVYYRLRSASSSNQDC